MKRRRTLFWLPLAGLASLALMAIGEGAEPAVPTLSVSVSRTAIHVGDVFDYRIRVRYPEGVSFVTQELERTLVLRPFELLEVGAEQKDLGDGGILDVVLKLACYQEPGRLEIPSFTLFYYPNQPAGQPGSAPVKDIPAKELVVPAKRIDLQTTLLGSEDALREPVTLLAFPRRQFLLPGIAAVLLLALLCLVAFRAGRYLVKRSRRPAGVDEEQLRREAVQALGRLQQSVGSEGWQRTAYLEISKVLRRYLQSRYGVSGPALTPEEMREILQDGSSGREFAEKMALLLERCDEGFFNRDAAPTPDPQALCQQAAGLLRSGGPARSGVPGRRTPR